MRGGTTTSNDNSTITATSGIEAAGIGGGYGGGGGTTTSNNTSAIIATGGQNAAGIGGGWNGNGSQVTVGAGTTVTASGGKTAIGAGQYDNRLFGHLTVAGTLRVPSGNLVIPDSDTTPGEAGDEVEVTSTGVITGSDDASPTYGTITGRPVDGSDTATEGQIANHGAILLPTVHVQVAVVRDRHYDVAFDPQGGSAAPSPLTLFAASFTKGARDFPIDPTRENFTFTGWNTTPDGTGDTINASATLPGSSSTGAAEPVSLYATWAGDPIPNPNLVVSGIPVEGRTLSVSATQPAGYRPPADYALSYRWFANGKSLKGRRYGKARIRIRPGMIGKKLSVRAIASASGHERATVKTPPLGKVTKAGKPYAATDRSAVTPGSRIYFYGLAPSRGTRYRITTTTPGIRTTGGTFGPRSQLRRHLTIPTTATNKAVFKVVMLNKHGKVVFKQRLRVTIQT